VKNLTGKNRVSGFKGNYFFNSAVDLSGFVHYRHGFRIISGMAQA